MASDEPSPWSEGTTDEPLTETTAQMVKRLERERAEEQAAIDRDQRLWENYANRLTAAGDLIR